MWTRSRSEATNLACVPLPLPYTPLITYLRTALPHEQRAVALDDLAAPEGRIVVSNR